MGQKTVTRTCLRCGCHFEAKTDRAKFCSGRCRIAAWKAEREREAAKEALGKVMAVIQEIMGDRG